MAALHTLGVTWYPTHGKQLRHLRIAPLLPTHYLRPSPEQHPRDHTPQIAAKIPLAGMLA